MSDPVVTVILAYDDPASLADHVRNVRFFCPNARLFLYNSGDDPALADGLDLETIPGCRRFDYGKVAPFYLQVFEWLLSSGMRWSGLVNLETDLLFIRSGFEAFVKRELADADYLAPNLVRKRPLSTRWTPMRSLRPDFQRWFAFLGFSYFHGTFSPAQIFSRRYIEALLVHPRYEMFKDLVANNRSFAFDEVIFPTLTDFLGLRLKGYPEVLRPINRYRPYQAVSGVKRGLAIPQAYFVHPVRRMANDPARCFIRSLEAPAFQSYS